MTTHEGSTRMTALGGSPRDDDDWEWGAEETLLLLWRWRLASARDDSSMALEAWLDEPALFLDLLMVPGL